MPLIGFMHVSNSNSNLYSYFKIITSKEIKPEFLEVHGTFIPCYNEVTLLGITIDDKLK